MIRDAKVRAACSRRRGSRTVMPSRVQPGASRITAARASGVSRSMARIRTKEERRRKGRPGQVGRRPDLSAALAPAPRPDAFSIEFDADRPAADCPDLGPRARRAIVAAVMRFDAQIGPCGHRGAPRRPSRGDVERAYGASAQNPLAPPESHDAGAAGILFREPEAAGRRVCTVWFWSATRIRARRSRSSSS